MDTGGARDVAEALVCALLGIPAAVFGFGAGLQQTKVGATMQQMSKQAWENGVLPFCRLAADELKRSLLPQFGKVDGLDVFWDTSDVPAMQEDEDQKAERWGKIFEAGMVQLYEAREALGMERSEEQTSELQTLMRIT